MFSLLIPKFEDKIGFLSKLPDLSIYIFTFLSYLALNDEKAAHRKIKDIRNQVDIKILVSLSCTMCPDLVIAAQHMAAVSEHITTEIYDIHHYESLKNKYKVMSVPCMIINDEHVYFGKKNIQQIVEIVEEIVK